MAVKVQRRDQVASIADFSGGLNNDVSPLNIRDNQVSEVLNMDFDDTGAITKRLGFTAYNAVALPGQPISGNELDQSNGNNLEILQVNETAKDVGAGTEARSVLWYTDGNGVFQPCPWFDTGTATFTNGSPTVTLAATGTTNAAQNMALATSFWIRSDGDATDTAWYTVASVAGNVLTLDRNFEGTGGAGASYEIVQPFVSGLECYYEQYKDSLLVFQSGSRPQRFDGTNCHFLENINPATDPTYADGGVGNVPAGGHHIIIVYDYGKWGTSVESTGSTHTVTGASETVDASSIPTGPQAVVNVRFYATLAGGTANDPHYLVGSVVNGIASDADIYNITDAALVNLNLFQLDLGATDKGWTAPVNGSIAKIMNERLFLVDSANNPSKISISKPFFPGAHPTANTIDVSTEDGQIINGLTESFGRLVILKDILHQYYLTRNSPLADVEKIPTDLGCRSHKSIALWRQWFIYMSSRGVALGTYQGSQLISRDITDDITGLKQALQRFGYFFATTQTELNTGATHTNTSVSTDGDIQIDVQTEVDTVEADFDAGTHLNTDAGVEDRDSNVQDGVTLDVFSTARFFEYKLRNFCRLPADGGDRGLIGSFEHSTVTPERGADGSLGTNWVSASATPSTNDPYTFGVTLLNPGRKIKRVECILQAVTTGNFNREITAVLEVRISGVWTEIDTLAGFGSTRADNIISGNGGRAQVQVRRFGNFIVGVDTHMAGDFDPVLVTGARVRFATYIGLASENIQFRVSEIRCYEPMFGLARLADANNVFISQEFDLGANPSIGTVAVTANTLFYGDNDTYANPADYGGLLTAMTTGNGGTAAALAGATAQFDIYVRSTSTSGSGYTAWVLQPNNGIFAAAFQQFVQYRIIFGNAAPDNKARGSCASLIQDVTIRYFPRGTYESFTIDTSQTPIRFGRILYDSILNGGSVQARVESRAADSGWGTFTNHDSGDLITVTPQRFVRVQFQLDGAPAPASAIDLSPLVSSFRIEWFSSSAFSAALPLAGKVHNDRYYLSGERPQATANDRVYMVDLRPIERGQQAPWTKYDWAINGFLISGNIFHGIPSDTAVMRNLLNGYDDAGVAIQAFAFTKPILNGPGIKIFKKSYLEADRANGSVNNNVTYIPIGDFTGFVGTPNNRITVDLNSELPIDGAYSGTEISGDLTLVAGGGVNVKIKTGPMGYTEGFGYRQISVGFSRDARLSNRGHYIFFKIFNNLLNNKLIKVHRIDVTYQPKNLRGASV